MGAECQLLEEVRSLGGVTKSQKRPPTSTYIEWTDKILYWPELRKLITQEAIQPSLRPTFRVDRRRRQESGAGCQVEVLYDRES